MLTPIDVAHIVGQLVQKGYASREPFRDRNQLNSQIFYGTKYQRSTNYTVLQAACIEGEVELVEKLLSDPMTDPNFCSNSGPTSIDGGTFHANAYESPLNLVCRKFAHMTANEQDPEKFHQIIRILMAHPGIDPNKKDFYGVYPIQHLISIVYIFSDKECPGLEKRWELINELLNHPKTKQDFDLLTDASWCSDRLDMFKKILDHPKIDPNIQTTRGSWGSSEITAGDTLLHTLCKKYGQMEETLRQNVMTILIEHPKTNPNVLNYKCETPLMALCKCCMSSDLFDIKCLISSPKIDPYVKDNYFNTCFYHAIVRNRDDILQLMDTNENIKKCIERQYYYIGSLSKPIDQISSFCLALQSGSCDVIKYYLWIPKWIKIRRIIGGLILAYAIKCGLERHTHVLEIVDFLWRKITRSN
jgi:hypothetical protein